MIDRPDAARLLRAMADTLTNQVLPATASGAQHSARVVANLCRILEREVRLGEDSAEATRRDLGDLLDREGTLAELVAALDDRLRQAAGDGTTKANAKTKANVEAEATFETRVHARLLADVERRLEIADAGVTRPTVAQIAAQIIDRTRVGDEAKLLRAAIATGVPIPEILAVDDAGRAIISVQVEGETIPRKILRLVEAEPHLGDPMEDLAWLCLRTWCCGLDDHGVGGFGRLDGIRQAYEEAGGDWDSLDRPRRFSMGHRTRSSWPRVADESWSSNTICFA